MARGASCLSADFAIGQVWAAGAAAAFDFAVEAGAAAAEEKPLAPLNCLPDPAAVVAAKLPLPAAASTSAMRSVSVHFLSERLSLAFGRTCFQM